MDSFPRLKYTHVQNFFEFYLCLCGNFNFSIFFQKNVVLRSKNCFTFSKIILKSKLLICDSSFRRHEQKNRCINVIPNL